MERNQFPAGLIHKMDGGASAGASRSGPATTLAAKKPKSIAPTFETPRQALATLEE
jgi:hypothetical protein